MTLQLNNSNFQETINSNDVVLVDFYADWCGPCVSFNPTLEDLSTEFSKKAVVAKINVDKNPELSQSFKIRSIPSLFYFKKGQLVEKQNGAQPIALLTEKLNNLINN
jgi:thioredoxin 1